MQKSQTHDFEVFDAGKFRVGLVCAQFNSDITDRILDSAIKRLKDFKIRDDKVDNYFVTGSVEIPVILQALAKTKKYDCLIAIGAIIKGKTDHYYYVAKMAVEGVQKVSLDYNLPIGLAVLTTPNKKLAQLRVNIGAEAAEAVLHNVKIIQSLQG